MSRAELLKEKEELERLVAQLELKAGPVDPEECPLRKRLAQLEAELAAGTHSPSPDWVELCHLCGRRCWL